MKIFLLLDPPTITAQETKVVIVHGKPRFYKPENVTKAKEELKKHLRPFKPEEPLDGPIELKVTWLFPRGKRHKHLEWRTTKPDTDNLEKLLKDCMTQLGFWKDDALVVREVVEKLWSDEPTGIALEIEILSDRKEETNETKTTAR